jgi:predicted nucleotidyltransferase
METANLIVTRCQAHYPDAQAIYLFGSRAHGRTRAASDHDIALLLPHDRTHTVGSLLLSPLHVDLMRELRTGVDLINLRRASTVLAKETISSGQRLYCGDTTAADEFEAHTLSQYQSLNVERAAILADFKQDKLPPLRT